jgi:hypothetical protein
LGAGLKDDWIDSDEGVVVDKMPTYFGDVSYSVKKFHNGYKVDISGDIQVPMDKIIFRNFNKSTPSRVLVDGEISNNFNENDIVINKSPASIIIEY